MTATSTEWKTDIQDWELVPLDTYKFIYEETKANLKSTIDIGEKITDRTFTLVGFVIPSVTLLAVFLLKTKAYQFSWWVVLLIFILMAIAILLTLQNVSIRNFYFEGVDPEDIFKEEYVRQSNLTDEENLKSLYFSEIKNTKFKIDQNDKINNKRLSNYQYIIISSSLSWMAISVIYFFTS